MRPKFEGSSMAQRLNNALAQLHSAKLEHQREKEQIISELERAREENQKFKSKNKELKKQIRDIELEGGRDSQNNVEAQQILSKIHNYLKRLQQSSQQLSQIAAECRIVDADIERAASQIQRNVIKSTSGLTKYVSELVKRWGSNQSMRLEHHRLSSQNRQLFELTTTLQHNFKQTDKLIKQLERLQKNEEDYQEFQVLKKKIDTLEKENIKLKTSVNTKTSTVSPKTRDSTQLEQKIVLFSQKIRRLEQENVTIKNIHQRTMKKLEKLEEKNQQKQEKPFEGEAIQDERKKWIEKTEEMYEEIRKLTKELMISQQSEKKVREQLNSCLQIYSRWQQERQHKKTEIQELKSGIETYLLKLEQLESIICQKNNQIEALQEKCEISQGQKEKIVTVYQLQVQQINDQLFKKQDAITELEEICNKEHFKLEELKKQYIEANKNCALADQKAKKIQLQNQELKMIAKQKENAMKLAQNEVAERQKQIKNLKAQHKTQINKLKFQIGRIENQKEELAQILEEIKDQYSLAKRQILKNQQGLQDAKQQQGSLEKEMRDILSFFDAQADIWTLIAKLRQKFKNFHEQLKTLREAQIRMISELQYKQSEYSQTLESIENKYLRACQQLQSTNKNQEAQFKIFKMKLLQKNLCNEQSLSFSKSMADLLQLLINKSCIEVEQIYPSPAKKNVEDIIELKQKLIQKTAQMETMAKQHKQASHQLSNLHQQILWKDKLMEENKQHIAALEQKLLQAEKTKKLLESKVHGSEKKVIELQQQIDALNLQQDALKQENNQLKLNIKNKVSQLRDVQGKSAALEGQLINAKKLIQNVKLLSTQNSQLKLSLDVLKDQLQKVNDLRTTQEQQKENIQNLVLENQQLRVSNSNLQGQLQSAFKQIADLLTESENLSFQNAQLQQQIIQLNKRLMLFEQKASVMLQNESKIRQDLNIKQKYAHETLQCLLKMQREKQELSVLNVSMEKQLNERDRQKRQAQTQGISNNYQLIKLNLQIQQKITLIDKLQEKVQALASQIIKKDSLIEQINKDKQMQSNEKKQLQEQIHLMQQQMRNLIANDPSQKIELDQQKQIEFDNLKNDYIEAQDQLAALAQEIKRKDVVIGRMQEQIDICKLKQLQLQQQVVKLKQIIETRGDQFTQNEQQIVQEEQYVQKQNELMKMIDYDANLPEHYQIITGQQEAEDECKQDFNQTGLNEFKKRSKFEQSKQEESKLIQEYYMQITAQNEEILQLRQKITFQLQQAELLKEQLQKYQLQNINLQNQYDLLQNKYRQLQDLFQVQKLDIQHKLLEKNNQVQSQKYSKRSLEADIGRLNSEIQRYKVKQQLFAQKVAQKQSQNQSLKERLKKEEGKLKSISDQLQKTKRQKENYCSRLQEIQHLMSQMQTDQNQVLKLKQICEENQNQKQVLLYKLEQLQMQLKKLNSNIDSLQNKNRALSQQKVECDQKISQYYQNIQDLTRQKLQYTQQVVQFQNLAHQLSKKGYSIKQISKMIDRVSNIQSQNSHSQQINSQYLREINLLKDKLKQSQKKASALQCLVNEQSIKMQHLQQQHLKSSEILKQIQRENDQSQDLSKCNIELRQQIADLKDQLQQKDKKANQFKIKLNTQLVLIEELQQKYNQKCKQEQVLKLQSQKYKTQMKKMSKQKVLAQSQMMKFKCDLQKKQQSSKLRDSQVSDEIKKNNTESNLIIKDLKRQIIELKQANSVLRQQKSNFLQLKSNRQERSERNFISQDQYIKDLPLQIGSRVSRQSSIRSQVQQKNIEYYQPQIEKSRQLVQEQNKRLKLELPKQGKEDNRLKEIQKNYKSLNNELQFLKGQMKVKNISIQNLQKQYKSKVQDYSKLQRNVESLNDELNLQRKRVKNFEDLYQNIQAKRLKLSRPENE